MSKQIAILIDNSGSMFAPVAPSEPDKIVQTSLGAQMFIQNMINAISPGEEFAFSLHRFASSHEVLGPQVSSNDPGFAAALNAIDASVSAVENQAGSQAAVGVLTDIYDAVRLTSDYLIATPPSFGAPDARYIMIFSDGIQTISHGGSTDRSGYETEQGVTFSSLLNGRNIRLRAWGIGSDALALVLRDLTNQAVDPLANDIALGHPGSYTKVLSPESETGAFGDSIALFMGEATTLVDDNGILPLRPAGAPPSGLLWEQFALPRVDQGDDGAKRVNHADFEVEVDGLTTVLIFGLGAHANGNPSLQITSPSGTVLTPASPGTVVVTKPRAILFKIPRPEQGTWQVRVTGDPQWRPLTLDLMARGVCKNFKLVVSNEPFYLAERGQAKIIAFPVLDGKPAEGNLEVTAEVLGGASERLEPQSNGSYIGVAEVTRDGINPVRVEVAGTLSDGRTIHRIEFTEVLVGKVTDPRLTIKPNKFEQGRRFSVELNLVDAFFQQNSIVSFGPGINVLSFQIHGSNTATAQIDVDETALVGEREVVLHNPSAESQGAVAVVRRKRVDIRVPSVFAATNRIDCLRFDLTGRLMAIELDDGSQIKVRPHHDRTQRVLERARDEDLSVKVQVDSDGYLLAVDVFGR